MAQAFGERGIEQGIGIERAEDFVDRALGRSRSDAGAFDLAFHTQLAALAEGRLGAGDGLGDAIVVDGALDPDALLDSALAKRLRHGGPIADEREFNRLYRYLVGQGFESDRVLARLKKLKSSK